jgi:2-haloacid dehalogenase
VLAALKAKGATLAILSNGDPDMLAEAVRAAKLEGILDDVLSVASVGVFKPSPAVYRLVTDRYRCQPQDISFQSSNRWDIAGAKAFGFHCVWVNRTGAPDEYPEMKPDRVARDLRALLDGA